MRRRLALLAVLPLILTLLLPAPYLAAEPTVAPAAKAAPTAAIDPDMDEGHRQFAHANYEKALEHYLQALERNEEDAYLHFRIGLTYYMLDDFDNSHVHWLRTFDFNNDFMDRLVTRIKGESMTPTLLNEDVIITDDQYHKYRKLKYDDIVGFAITPSPNDRYSKRIVGLPGDYIEIIDNSVFIDGKRLDEKYIYNDERYKDRAIKNMKKMQIPKDSYFVLNDNRNWSYDSRYFGVIDKSEIVGKVLGIMERPSRESQSPREQTAD